MSSGTRGAGTQGTGTQRAPSRADSHADTSQIAAEKLQQAGQHFVAEPAKDIFGVLRDYANDKPDVAAMWCFGIGVIVGWKLRG